MVHPPPRLAWVQLDTSGIDHVVSHPIWTDGAIPVTTIGGVSARWTAEYVVMMLLVARHPLSGSSIRLGWVSWWEIWHRATATKGFCACRSVP